MSEKETGIWAWVGKVATLVAVVGGVVGIYQYASAPAAKVVATVAPNFFAVPPTGFGDQLGDSTNGKLRITVDGAVTSPPPSPKGYYSVRVENRGSKDADAVAFYARGVIVAEVLNDETGKKSLSKTDRIELGTIRAGAVVNASIWTRSEPSPEAWLSMRVNTNEGLGSVQRLEWAGGNNGLPWWAIAFLLFFCVVSAAPFLDSARALLEAKRKLKAG